jgi:hypothetical protein
MMKKLLVGVVCGLVLATGASGAASFSFEKKVVAVTAKPDQDVVACDFAFEVEGEGEATIANFDVPCSCLEAQISDNGRLVWEAGETGTVRGLFKTGTFRGTVDKNITLVMADGAKHTLTIRLTMPELLKIEPKTLKWQLGGDGESKSFEITTHAAEPLHITQVSGTNDEKFPYELETLEEGKRYRLTISPSNIGETGFGLIRFLTDSKYEKHKSYQAFAVVAK